MAKYRKKPVVIEAITFAFDELVAKRYCGDTFNRIKCERVRGHRGMHSYRDTFGVLLSWQRVRARAR